MEIKGLSLEQVNGILKSLHMAPLDINGRVGKGHSYHKSPGAFTIRVGRDGKPIIKARIQPESGHVDSPWSRRSPSGRRLRALCGHGFDAFITACFRAGATRIKTAQGQWTDVADFGAAVPGLLRINIGSVYEPFFYEDSCECVCHQHGGFVPSATGGSYTPRGLWAKKPSARFKASVSKPAPSQKQRS